MFKCSPQPKLLLCLLLLLLLFSGQQAENAQTKNRVNPPKIPGGFQVFRVLPALDAGDPRGSLVGLPYCCSAGLTLATAVGEPNCCSVVTVNTSNTVQLLTFDSSTDTRTRAGHAAGGRAWSCTVSRRAWILYFVSIASEQSIGRGLDLERRGQRRTFFSTYSIAVPP